MDWSHFGMARRPFRPAVDTGAYFPTAGHEAALATLRSAFDRREPAVLLDGPAGTGKSLVARLWLERLPADVPRVVLPNVPADKPTELLQAILFDLDQHYQGLSEQELRLAVTGQLLAAGMTVLVIDEAHHLGPAALEELRLLGNIETRDGSALFLLLVAPASFRTALARPEYAGFAQRAGVRCGVEAFTPEESAAYLRHQVRAAGGTPARVFDDEAVSLLAGACGGVARTLNRAAAIAAELAAAGEADRIDVEAALEALTRLGLDATAEPAEPFLLRHPGQSAKPTTAVGAKDTGGRGAAGGEPRVARGTKPKAARKRSA